MLLHVVGSLKMENYKCTLSVVDVYDIAQDIGREFESIIDAYGTEAITGLMPKVVNVLEQMEILALKNERENTTVEDLRATIQQLEVDKQERTEDRIKYEKVCFQPISSIISISIHSLHSSYLPNAVTFHSEYDQYLYKSILLPNWLDCIMLG